MIEVALALLLPYKEAICGVGNASPAVLLFIAQLTINVEVFCASRDALRRWVWAML